VAQSLLLTNSNQPPTRPPGRNPPNTQYHQPFPSPAIPITISQEVRWQIFDQAIANPRTIVMHPDKVHRGVLDNLASSCTQLAEEISAWLKKRPDLLKHSTFGVVDPTTTTFKLTWQFTSPAFQETELYQRIIPPSPL
jgi:hypothetical protein